MKYLVIGDAGFLGKAFCEHLISQEQEILGIDAIKEGRSEWQRMKVNIEDVDRLYSIIRRFRPSIIINFAGIFEDAGRERNFKINCFAVIDLLAKCLSDNDLKKIRFVLIGSAAEYGIPERISKFNENSPINPITNYGISKACQTFFAKNMSDKNKAVIITARPFNIIGRGMSDRLFLGHCASQIVKIEKGRQRPVLHVGNIENYRDVISLPKAIEMIYEVSRKGRGGEIYNICSGKAVKMKTLLSKLIKYSGVKIQLQIDPGQFRRHDAKYVAGDNRKYLRLTNKTSFADYYGVDAAIKDTLDWYRSIC